MDCNNINKGDYRHNYNIIIENNYFSALLQRFPGR